MSATPGKAPRMPSLAESGELPISRDSRVAPHREIHLDRYWLLGELGGGRAGISYFAVPRDRAELSNLLVVRALRPQLLDEESVVRAFNEQALLSARLVHRNIQRTIDFGIEGHPYVAMEYVDGRPLEAILRRARQRGSPIELKVQLRILLDVLTALHFAHSTASDGLAQGIVHGQLSPRKVLIGKNGQVKVADFGFPHTAVVPSETPTAPLRGSIRYTAPEVVTDKEVDWHADVFAVGAMLWEAMVGRPPGDDQPDVVVLQRLLSGRLPRIGDVAPHADSALVAIVERAMAPDAADRYPSAKAMRQALEHYAAARTVEVGPDDPPTAGGVHLTARQVMAGLVTTLFGDDRKAMMEIVETRIRAAAQAATRIRVAAHTAPANQHELLARTPSGAPAAAPASPGVTPPAPPPPLSSSGSAPTAAVQRFRGPLKSKRGVGAAVLIALFAGSLGLCKQIERTPPPGPSASAEPSVSARPRSSPTSADSAGELPPTANVALVQRIRLSIRVSPPWAKLLLDGNAVPNPFMAVVTADGSIHTLRAEAPGYIARARSLAFHTDSEIEIELAPRRPRHPADNPYGMPIPMPYQALPDAGPDAAIDETLGVDKSNPYHP